MAISRIPRAICSLLSIVVTCSVFTGCNQSSAFMMNESGKSLYAQGQYTAARREFERALIDNPGNSDYAFNVASAMRKQGDLIGAERMYRHALNLDPRHQPAHHGVAAMLVDQGRTAEADSHLREWANTQPHLAEAHIENAWLQQDMGNLAAAEQSLHRALQTDPKHPVALAQLGHLHEMNGRPGEAQAMYQRSLSGNPFQSEVKARVSESGRSWPTNSGVAMAAYPPPNGQWGQWTGQAMQQTSAAGTPYPITHPGASPVQAPFQGFASTAGPNPLAAGYGQQTFPPQYPQPASVPQAWPAAPPSYGHPVATSPLGQPQPMINADPAHAPLATSSVPVVAPF